MSQPRPPPRRQPRRRHRVPARQVRRHLRQHVRQVGEPPRQLLNRPLLQRLPRKRRRLQRAELLCIGKQSGAANVLEVLRASWRSEALGDGRYAVWLPDEQDTTRIFAAVHQASATVRSLHLKRRSLEDVFLTAVRSNSEPNAVTPSAVTPNAGTPSAGGELRPPSRRAGGGAE